MSADAVLPSLPTTRVERRCCHTPWGLKIETWRLVHTRTLPAESARLPFALLLEEETAALGAIPRTATDQDDTLEAPLDGDVTNDRPPVVQADDPEDQS
jgi:hypothetical protein